MLGGIIVVGRLIILGDALARLESPQKLEGLGTLGLIHTHIFLRERACGTLGQGSTTGMGSITR